MPKAALPGRRHQTPHSGPPALKLGLLHSSVQSPHLPGLLSQGLITVTFKIKRRGQNSISLSHIDRTGIVRTLK